MNFCRDGAGVAARRAGAEGFGVALTPNAVGPEPVTIGCCDARFAERLERGGRSRAERAGGALEVVDGVEASPARIALGVLELLGPRGVAVRVEHAVARARAQLGIQRDDHERRLRRRAAARCARPRRSSTRAVGAQHHGDVGTERHGSSGGIGMSAMPGRRGAARRRRDPDGFVLGEGSGILVLERAEFAAARGATVHGRLSGAGLTSDAYHITGPEPEGIGQSRAIAAAVRDAGLEPGDVGHVNCHATSTVAGDVGETRAVRKALGDHPVLTAPKSALGHLVGAAGAVESIITVLSIRDGIIPATLNLENLDPGVELDVVAGEPRKMDMTAAVCDSFGFGGHDAAVTFTKLLSAAPCSSTAQHSQARRATPRPGAAR